MDISITIIPLFTGVSVLFNEARIEHHLRLWKCLLLMRDEYAPFYSISDRHSVSDSLESSPKRYSFIGLQHSSSSAIHKQASVHTRLFILQEQLRLHSEVVQRHVVSSLMPDGAGGLVIRTGTSLTLSNFHPFPSGEGTFWSDTRALFQTKAWKFALSIWWQRHSDVGGRSSLFRLFWQKRKYRASSALTKLFPDT